MSNYYHIWGSVATKPQTNIPRPMLVCEICDSGHIFAKEGQIQIKLEIRKIFFEKVAGQTNIISQHIGEVNDLDIYQPLFDSTCGARVTIRSSSDIFFFFFWPRHILVFSKFFATLRGASDSHGLIDTHRVTIAISSFNELYFIILLDFC